jgi:hypothetical protein
MSYSFLTNQSPVDIAHGFYAFMGLLVSAGFTVVSSGDGLSLYSSSGNILTGGGSGAGGLGNGYAWFRVQAPAVNGQTREYIVQRAGSGGYQDDYWAFKYSASAGFTGGSPDSTHVPTATDEVGIFGNITGTNQTYDYWWQPGQPVPRMHFCVGGAAEKYSFYLLFAWTGTINGPYSFWAMDVLQTALAADTDPAVSYCIRLGTANVCCNDLFNQNGPCAAWMGAGFFGSVRILYPQNGIPAGMGVNAWTNKDDAIPLFWYRSSTPYGFKGWSTLYMWNTVGRACFDTLSIASTADHLYMNGCLLPWDGSVPLI